MAPCGVGAHARHGPVGTLLLLPAATASAAPPSPRAISKLADEAFLRPVRPWVDPYQARAGLLEGACGRPRPRGRPPAGQGRDHRP